MVDVCNRVVVPRPPTAVQLGRHALQPQCGDAGRVRLEVQQPPLQRVLLKVVIGMIAPTRKVPPKSEEPMRRRRVPPKLHSSVGAQAEGPIRGEGDIPIESMIGRRSIRSFYFLGALRRRRWRWGRRRAKVLWRQCSERRGAAAALVG